MTKRTDPFNQTQQRSNLFSSRVFQVTIGVVIGLGVLGIIYYTTNKRGLKTLPQTGDGGIISSINNADIIISEEDLDIFSAKWDEHTKNNIEGIDDYIEYALSDGARFDGSKPILKVGEETIYGCDLNVNFVMHDFVSYFSRAYESLDDENLESTLDAIIIQSGILQEGDKLGIIQLDDTFFNSPTKNIDRRNYMVKLVRDTLEKKYIKRIDFEAIIIYFHNQEPPEEVSLSEAKEAARKKMQILYERVVNGEISMREAGKEIENDRIKGDKTNISLSKLDPVYRTNAYMNIIGHEIGNQLLTDDSFDDRIKTMASGQIEGVLLLKDYKYTWDDLYEATNETEFEMVDSCYAVVKVNNIREGEFGIKIADTVGDIDTVILAKYKDFISIKFED